MERSNMTITKCRDISILCLMLTLGVAYQLIIVYFWCAERTRIIIARFKITKIIRFGSNICMNNIV